MEKQEHSNETKFNKITTFLIKFIFQDSFDYLKKAGYVDSYTSDPEIMKILELDPEQRILFLLFKNKKLKLEEIKKIINITAKAKIDIIFSYELVNDYAMIVINFPKNYIRDYDNLVQGKYSKLSPEFKQAFPETREVLNTKGLRIGKEYTMYYHLFNKTDWLKQFWADKLNLVEVDDNLELWSSPTEEDLIFNIKTII